MTRAVDKFFYNQLRQILYYYLQLLQYGHWRDTPHYTKFNAANIFFSSSNGYAEIGQAAPNGNLRAGLKS
jgi:hypothetical protein